MLSMRRFHCQRPGTKQALTLDRTRQAGRKYVSSEHLLVGRQPGRARYFFVLCLGLSSISEVGFLDPDLCETVGPAQSWTCHSTSRSGHWSWWRSAISLQTFVLVEQSPGVAAQERHQMWSFIPRNDFSAKDLPTTVR